MPRLVIALLLAPALAFAAEPVTTPRPSVTVIVQGEEPMASALRTALADGPVPVDRRIATVPSGAEGGPDFAALEARASAARIAYVGADFATCLSGLGAEEIWAPLAAGRRTLVARLLLWQAACETGSGDSAAAKRTAALFAGLGLEAPAEIASASPEVESRLAEAATASSKAARVRVEVASGTSGATVAIDGRPAACVTPCTVDLAPGEHVVRVEADGWAPADARFRAVPPSTQVSVKAQSASPELTSAQWVRRYAAQGDTESAASIRLLSSALRTERLVVVTAAKQEPNLVFRGVLGVSGDVVARTQRDARDDAQLDAAAEGLLRDLLVEGRVLEPAKPLAKRWGFWAGVVAASLAAGGVTAYSLYEPPTRTEVTW